MVAYRFEDSRGSDCVKCHLAGYDRLLQVDGWAAYNRLAETKRRGGPLTLPAYWAHLRRKFYELHSETIERMAGQKSAVTRREQMVGDGLQLTLDLMHWNAANPDEEPIELPMDLSFDIELRLNAPDEDDEAA